MISEWNKLNGYVVKAKIISSFKGKQRALMGGKGY